jgi:hypothetical protein
MGARLRCASATIWHDAGQHGVGADLLAFITNAAGG